MLNLVSNSLKFTSQGGITIEVDRLDDKIEFVVKDTGIGIKDSERSKLFMEFGMGNDEGNLNSYGSGLGLSICKKFVEKLGGEIFLSSAQHIGTCVRFFIKPVEIFIKQLDQDEDDKVDIEQLAELNLH